MIVAVVTLGTAVVVTVNVAEVDPEGTVTLVGFCALALLAESATVMPPLGAAPFRVAVPMDEFPPRTLVGLRVTEERLGGFTVRVCTWVTL